MSNETATWHMIKYLPDLRRREPRNVGLVLATPEGWLTKFVGEAPDGEIKGNRVKGHSDLEVYKTWVSYFRRKAELQRWEDVERLQRLRRSNYFSEVGGEIYDREGKSWRAILDVMFAELVQDQVDRMDQVSISSREYILSQARSALAIANVQYEEKVEVPARFGNRMSTVPFEFRYTNGVTHLMDTVNIHGRNAASRARELRARIVAAREARPGKDQNPIDFFTFYIAGDNESERVDEVLMPLEAESFAIEVSNVGNAADRVAELVAA